MNCKNSNPAARVLVDISRARTSGQLEKIDRSPQARALKGADAAAVAAAASDRMFAVDYDVPVPRGGA